MAQVSVTFDCPDHDPSSGMQAIDWQGIFNAMKPYIIQIILAIVGANPPAGGQGQPGQQQPGGRKTGKP